jgi:NADH-quinone oxidoreductase subunit C/D
MTNEANNQLISALQSQFGEAAITVQKTAANFPVLWVSAADLKPVMLFLKSKPYEFSLLLDLFAIDERLRKNRDGQPASDFTVVYHLISIKRNQDVRLKIALTGEYPNTASVTDIWKNANWYEREVWDMFGIKFDGHPLLRRILTPPTFEGHPLRKEFAGRGTERERFSMTPEDYGLKSETDGTDFMFLNLGPNHPSVHGAFRIVLQLDGERIVNAFPDIGYHHRGAEKIAERQTWHGFIPYTDRIDYLGGVMNNLPYVIAIEQMAGIEVPARAQCIRVMLAECFRILSHILFYGTFATDVGQMSPIFYLFEDREKLFGIIEAITGARMHPSWFRIGGLAADLPAGWKEMMTAFVEYFPAKLDEYEPMIMENSIFKGRTVGIGKYNTEEALEWGVTGPGLRATGCNFDLRKARPYSGYENYEFDIPVAYNGDCYDRCRVRVEEMRQSIRIIKQCIEKMPDGPYKAQHTATTPPLKDRSKQDIETLIQHFLNVSWGPNMAIDEAYMAIEATKGINSYSLINDGTSSSYRTRIRTPSFPHLQMIPFMARGGLLSDLIPIIGAIDFVMADVDR